MRPYKLKPIIALPVGAAAYLLIKLQTYLLWGLVYRWYNWPGNGYPLPEKYTFINMMYTASPTSLWVASGLWFAATYLCCRRIGGNGVVATLFFFVGSYGCVIGNSLLIRNYYSGNLSILEPFVDAFFLGRAVAFGLIVYLVEPDIRKWFANRKKRT